MTALNGPSKTPSSGAGARRFAALGVQVVAAAAACAALTWGAVDGLVPDAAQARALFDALASPWKAADARPRAGRPGISR